VVEYLTQNSSTYGPASIDGVIHDAVNVGWSWYSRRPAKAYFTLRQGSVHNARLLPLKHHIRIWYLNEVTGYGPVLVFSGRLNEPDSSAQDVVWSAWSYMADLSLSRTGYRKLYPKAKIGSEIAQVEWKAARGEVQAPNYPIAVTYSLLAHVATGTIEDPLDSLGATAIITDTRFGVIDVPRLLLMFDLTEIGRANTTNNVVFEITRATPTFNFWKNKGSAYTAKRLTMPGNVRDFRFIPGFASLRNDLATIGTSATGSATEIVKTDEASALEWGRRQDVFQIKTLSGVAGAASEVDAQNAVTDAAVRQSVKLAKDLLLDIREQHIEPFDGWDIEDLVTVQIKRGKDTIDATYRVLGTRGVQNAGGYHGQLLLTVPTA
jgi:hypothetical protein